MTDPVLRSFRSEDLVHIVGNHVEPYLISQALRGLSFTAEWNGQPIGCAGIMICWPGFGSCWLLASPLITEHRLWLIRIVRRVIAEISQALSLYRLEALAVSTPAQEYGRWLELIGFAREQDGCATSYTPKGLDMIRYQLVRRTDRG